MSVQLPGMPPPKDPRQTFREWVIAAYREYWPDPDQTPAKQEVLDTLWDDLPRRYLKDSEILHRQDVDKRIWDALKSDGIVMAFVPGGGAPGEYVSASAYQTALPFKEAFDGWQRRWRLSISDQQAIIADVAAWCEANPAAKQDPKKIVALLRRSA